MKYKFEDIIFNITQKKKPVEEDKYNYIGLEHLESGNLFISKWGADTAPEGEKIVMKKGDVLFGKRRAYQKKVAISPIDGIFSAHGMVLRPKEDVICKEFLPFFISSETFLNEAIRISVGGLSPTVNWKDIKEIEFDLPPLAEQKVLAEKLWAAYEVKQSYLKMIAATEEMVKSQFIEMFGNPVTNTKGWATMSISEVAPEEPSKDKMKGSVWILNLDMIESNTGKVINKIYEEDSNLLSVAPFDEGNVLYSKLRPYLNKVVIPDGKGYATTELVPLRPKQDILNLTFFSHLLRSSNFVSFANGIATGTKMPRMPLNDLRKFKCILPPLNLQREFEAIANQADKSISDLRKSVDAIDKVIKSLINEKL
jgi:type I restriction enzyme S subunit